MNMAQIAITQVRSLPAHLSVIVECAVSTRTYVLCHCYLSCLFFLVY
jgi:hypothetical protein